MAEFIVLANPKYPVPEVPNDYLFGAKYPVPHLAGPEPSADPHLRDLPMFLPNLRCTRLRSIHLGVLRPGHYF